MVLGVHIRLGIVSTPKSHAGNLVIHLSLGKPWRRKWLPIPVFLPGELHGLAGYNPWGRKDSDMTESLTIILLSVSKT